MLFLKTDNLNVLYTEKQMRSILQSGGISAPSTPSNESLLPFGWAMVEPATIERKPGMKYAVIAEKCMDGSYKRAFVEVPMTTAEIEEIATRVREERAGIMNATIDRINPIRWGEFSEEQRQIATNFRSDLLNISIQQGFPFEVMWPTVPDFLK